MNHQHNQEALYEKRIAHWKAKNTRKGKHYARHYNWILARMRSRKESRMT